MFVDMPSIEHEGTKLFVFRTHARHDVYVECASQLRSHRREIMESGSLQTILASLRHLYSSDKLLHILADQRIERGDGISHTVFIRPALIDPFPDSLPPGPVCVVTGCDQRRNVARCGNRITSLVRKLRPTLIPKFRTSLPMNCGTTWYSRSTALTVQRSL